jgi:arylsulfatase A-like enzyme
MPRSAIGSPASIRAASGTRVPRQGALLFALIAGLACGPNVGEQRALDPRPNIVLISMDTTRADHLSVYGYERPTSPRIDALAREGVRFEIAYAPSATTGPTHASLFTSLYPTTHGVRKNGRSLGSGFDTLAEILERAGFETAAVVSSYVLSRRFGYAQGFDHFDDDFSKAGVPSGVTVWEGEEIEGKFYGRADDTTRRALEWLDGRREPATPFFLFVHYFDPHDPYLLPEGFQPPFRPGPKEALKLNREIFRYDSLIAFTDREIGRLLDGLEERALAGDTLVVLTGDHGEGLMQHGHMFHGVHLYEEGVRVPLVLRWPGRLDPGRVVPEPVALMDLTPTILALAGSGAEGAAEFEGESLVPSLLGDAQGDPERPVYLYRRRYEGGEVAKGVFAEGEKFGIRVGRWKLIDGPDEGTLELYDLEADPEERENLAGRERERADRMRARLGEWRRRTDRVNPETAPLTDAERRRLEALGYVE